MFNSRLIFVICMSALMWTECVQAQVYENQGVTLSPAAKRIKRDFTTVIFSSLAGGILGLSTLSFYGQPQEHTVNITTGILLGLAGGLGYVIYNRTGADSTPTNNYRPSIPIDEDAHYKIPAKGPTYLAFSWEFE